jgi:hypothetical protein
MFMNIRNLQICRVEISDLFFNTEAKSAYTTPLQTENLQTEPTKSG